MNEHEAQWHKIIAADTPKDKPYHGLVYVIEHGDYIKIGQSRKFKKRVEALRKAEKYGGGTIGKYLVTALCTNFKEIEQQLHAHFIEYRVGRAELFNITLQDFLAKVPILIFKDDSDEMDKKAERMFESFKQFTLGGR